MSDNEKRNMGDKCALVIKILLILNIVIMVGMFLFCYRNSDLEVEGICDECSLYTGGMFLFSKLLLVIQAIMGIIMLKQIRDLDETYNNAWVSGLACVNIFFSAIQTGVFYFIPGASTHDESYRDIVEQIDMQICVAEIISIVLLVMSIALFVLSRLNARAIRKGAYDAV